MNDISNIFMDAIKIENKDESLLIVRLSTSCWSDKDGLYLRKNIKFLKRKCKNFNILENDCDYVGAVEVFPRIVNLDKCEDGIYQVITCNEHGSDWEIPHIIDEYDYKLISYKEEIKI